MTTPFGIDYASVDANERPDFNAARKAGCRFALIRGAYGTYRDTTVARDREALRRAGIQFGAYLYLRHPNKKRRVASPETQARALIAAVGVLEPGDLPPTIDIEYGRDGRAGTILSARQAIEWASVAYDTLQQVYGTVMVYTSLRVWNDDLLDMPAPAFGLDPLWIKTPYYWKARRPWDVTKLRLITDLPRPWRETNRGAWIQQIQGDALGVPGFSSTVDINLFLSMWPGEKSGRVTWVQKQLGIKQDGAYGADTLIAVHKLQQENSLMADGIIGPKTFAVLCQ